MLFAMWEGSVRSWSITELLIAVIIIAACVGIVIVALRQFQVSIPPFVVQIFWIVVCCFVAIFAIRLIASM